MKPIETRWRCTELGSVAATVVISILQSPTFVMAGLVPAIHVFLRVTKKKKDVDARHKAGHDGGIGQRFHLSIPRRRKRQLCHRADVTGVYDPKRLDREAV